MFKNKFIRFAAQGTLLGAFLVGTSAYASNGACPAGQDGPSPFKPVTKLEGAVTVTLEGETELGDQTIGAKGWHFRSRLITMAPGAKIPLHSHNDRPENVYMKLGAITIYETTCKVSYVMREGQTYQSSRGKAHWAVNETDHYATMYVTDILNKETFPVPDHH